MGVFLWVRFSYAHYAGPADSAWDGHRLLTRGRLSVTGPSWRWWYASDDGVSNLLMIMVGSMVMIVIGKVKYLCYCWRIRTMTVIQIIEKRVVNPGQASGSFQTTVLAFRSQVYLAHEKKCWRLFFPKLWDGSVQGPRKIHRIRLCTWRKQLCDTYADLNTLVVYGTRLHVCNILTTEPARTARTKSNGLKSNQINETRNLKQTSRYRPFCCYSQSLFEGCPLTNIST